MRKRHVLHIIKSLGRGGAEVLLVDTFRHFNRQHFQFHVLYFLPWKNQLVKAIEDQGISVHCMSSSGTFKMLLRIPRVVAYIKANKIELLHCHLPWSGIVGRLAGRIVGVPVIYTEHNLQERYHYLTRFFNRVTFDMQRLCIAVSTDVHTSITKNIAPRTKIITLFNGIDSNKWQRDLKAGLEKRSLLGIPEGAVVIGTVAVLRVQKRLDIWLEIVQNLIKDTPNVYAVIVGAGPSEVSLRKKIKELGIGAKVFMPGLQVDVIPWLSLMDIYLITSKFEGLPIAMLEAMSMQCAIASTDAGGIKDVIVNGNNGVMVSTEKPFELVELLRGLVETPTQRNHLAAKGRERVLASFEVSSMVKSLEAHYKTILDERI